MKQLKQLLAMTWRVYVRKYKRALIQACLVCITLAMMFWAVQSYHSCRVRLSVPGRPRYMCTEYKGRYGNLMFQYAFHYAFAQDRNLNMISVGNNTLRRVFDLPFLVNNNSDDEQLCSCFPSIEDSVDCALDRNIAALPGETDYFFKGYFQSWKYWKNYESDLRQHFQIRPEITQEAKVRIKVILYEKFGAEIDGITLVGIHVRRGDMTEDFLVDFGYQLATPEYLLNAMNYFIKHYNKVLFIGGSNSPDWLEKTLGARTDVYVLRGNSAEMDFAILTQMDHTISTVGSFGWWIAWLTNGTTIYYKYPFTPGSALEKQFDGRFTEDFIYPSWIGME